MFSLRNDLTNVFQVLEMKKYLVRINANSKILHDMERELARIININGNNVCLTKMSKGKFVISIIRFGTYIPVINATLFPSLSGKVETNKFVRFRVFPGAAIFFQLIILLFWLGLSIVVVPMVHILTILFSDTNFNFLPLTIGFILSAFIVFKIMAAIGRAYRNEKDSLIKYFMSLSGSEKIG